MATLAASVIDSLILDALVANPTTDAPFATAEKLRAINEAYAQVWEIGGPSVKNVSSATAWTSDSTAAGIIHSAIQDINELLHVYATTTAPQAIVCATNSNTTVTSAVLFGSVVVGMGVTGTGIPTGAYVVAKASSSSLTISIAATTTAAPTLTFASLGNATADNELDKVELSELEWFRKSSLTGTYTRPQMYAVSRISSANVSGEVQLLQLNYWPSVTGFYFPIKYLPQFTPLTALSTEVPDVNDLESYDIAWLAAADLAPRIGRSDLVPGLLMKVSSGTAKALERKMAAMMSGDQDNAGAA